MWCDYCPPLSPQSYRISLNYVTWRVNGTVQFLGRKVVGDEEHGDKIKQSSFPVKRRYYNSLRASQWTFASDIVYSSFVLSVIFVSKLTRLRYSIRRTAQVKGAYAVQQNCYPEQHFLSWVTICRKSVKLTLYYVIFSDTRPPENCLYLLWKESFLAESSAVRRG